MKRICAEGVTIRRRRGSALLLVLAILALLLIVATVFLTRWQHEVKASGYPDAHWQARLAAESACQDVLSRLAGQTVHGSRYERWWRDIAVSAPAGMARMLTGLLACPGAWRVAHDAAGRAVARYTVQVEDESGKLNVNILGRAIDPGTQAALSPAEIPMLDEAALPLSGDYFALAELRRLYDARRERTGDSVLARLVPRVDLAFVDPIEILNARRVASLPAFISVLPGEQAEHPRINLNTASARSLSRALGHLNEELHFEDDAGALDQVCVNIVDSRDANHVVTTLNRAYGIESVVINEVLAHNDEHYVDACGFSPLGAGNGGAVRASELYESPRDEFQARILKPHVYTVAEIDPEGVRVRLSADSRDGDMSASLNGQLLAQERDLPAASLYDLIKAVRGPNVVDGVAGVQWPENLFRGRVLLLSDTPEMKTVERRTVRASLDAWLWLDAIGAAPTGQWYAAFEPLLTRDGVALREPYQSDAWYVHGLVPGRYYCAQVFSFAGRGGVSGALDADGVLLRPSATAILDAHSQYARRVPQRAQFVEGFGGVVRLVLTGRPTGSRPSMVNYLRLYGPEAIELYNTGPEAVSLRGWTLVVDRGAEVRELHTIDDVVHYSVEMQMQTHDSNPVIERDGYMFVVNDQSLFDRAYGSLREGIWGNDQGEGVPLTRARRDTWGIPYRIEDVRPGFDIMDGMYRQLIVTCRGAAWTIGELRGELVQNRVNRTFGDGQDVRGTTFVVADNDRHSLTLHVRPDEVGIPWRRGDTIDILGLPRAGIDGALLLRDTYDQVCARADRIPGPRRERAFASVAKTDPGSAQWVVLPAARMGGMPVKCHNPLHARLSGNPVNIRNEWFGSVLDALGVRSAHAWENLDAGGGRAARVRRWLQVFLDECSTPTLWLSAEDADHVEGDWQRAFGASAVEATTTLVDREAQWAPDMWIGHRLNVRSGARAGQSYPVTKSTENSLSVVGRSVPGRAYFRVKEGDRYCVGPQSTVGYYVTRSPRAEGVWEWHDPRLVPGTYRLTLLSVNDSIDATTLLEENWNAEMTVRAWNFRTQEYDTLVTRRRSDKGDLVDAGALTPDHVESNMVRLAVQAAGVNAPGCSGIAWFGGVLLDGVHVPGRINVNSAAPTVLRMLPRMDADVLESIFAGRGTDAGRAAWESLSQVAEAADWPLDALRASANLVRADSAGLRVTCVGEALEDVNGDGLFNPDDGDRIRAQDVRTFLVTPVDAQGHRWRARTMAAQPHALRWLR